MATSATSIEQLAINTIRTLSMDGVQKANSGHPGTAMALAPVTYSIWNNHLSFDPSNPCWPGRDRFVLSCGHASMLLYSTLHVAGVKATDADGNPTDQLSITIDSLQKFRQLHSPCAGHPELGEAAGIETTTGPLGQGISNSVGMAMAAKWYAARYNKPGFDLFDFNTYALCGDGDLMEGVSCETASLAGHLKLSNLCWIYDDNHITIEGNTELAFTENVAQRFEGLGWNVVKVKDANDLEAIDGALNQFQQTNDQPTLVIVRSVIGYGAPNKQDTHGAHGAPLGEDEIGLAKDFYGWSYDKFEVPEDVPAHFADGIGKRGAKARGEWMAKFAEYKKQYPSQAAELETIWSGGLPEDWEAGVPEFAPDEKGLATRVSSGKVLNGIADCFPWMIGGSADLAPSNMTNLNDDDMGDYSAENYGGRNMHFGIREHGMAAICNGMSLSGLRVFGGTFFVFSDYMRGAMRLSALMKQGVIYVLTHDSIGLGEDGPTHQPVEHLAANRSIPGLRVMRPADANEVAESYRVALSSNDNPYAMVLTRQNVATLDRSKYGCYKGTAKGAYVLSDCEGEPQVLLLGTGSEVGLCLEAQERLASEGIRSRVVSMPCWELFDEQDADYRSSVLPENVTARVAVEAGIRFGWDKYIGSNGEFIGMDSFGASAPAGTLYKHFGITTETVVEAAKKAIA